MFAHHNNRLLAAVALLVSCAAIMVTISALAANTTTDKPAQIAVELLRDLVIAAFSIYAAHPEPPDVPPGS